MKKTHLLSLSAIITLPVFLSGCESLFREDPTYYRDYTPESSIHHYYDGEYGGGTSASRSYGRGSSGGGRSTKPRSNRPSTSSTAESIESAEVPIEPPSLE